MGGLVLTLTALVGLSRRQVDDAVRALWAIFVVLIPWLRALEFFIASPSRAKMNEAENTEKRK